MRVIRGSDLGRRADDIWRVVRHGNCDDTVRSSRVKALILAELGVETRTEALIKAIEAGLAGPPDLRRLPHIRKGR